MKEEIGSKDKELKKVLKQVDRATNMELETNQGVDTSKPMNQTPKPQREKPKNPRSLEFNSTADTTIELNTAESTRTLVDSFFWLLNQTLVVVQEPKGKEMS